MKILHTCYFGALLGIALFPMQSVLCAEPEQSAQATDSTSSQEITADEGVVTEGFKLSVTPRRKEYPFTAFGRLPVSLSVNFRNKSRWNTMLVSLGRTLAYPLEVIGPDGKPARLTEVGKRVLETRRRDSSHRIVHDGYTEDFQIRADYFYDMREPGEYKLRVSREVPSKADPRKTVRIYSNVVKIRIEGPQDKE